MFFFTPLRGFSFTFPSLYFFTIGHSGVFSLTRWSSLIHTGFHVPHATRDIPKKRGSFWLLDFHHLWCRIQLLRLIFLSFFLFWIPTTPLVFANGLGCSHFARRYFGNRFCFLFLWLLRCFSSPGCLFLFYEFKKEFYRGCPIRESSDLCLFPAPRSVSPVSAPFIVSECLGLHRKPSFLWPKK